MFACILRLFAFIHFCLLFSFTDHCCICSHAPPLRQPPPPSQLCSAQTGQSARTSTKWSGSVSSRSASHGTARPLFPHQLAQDMASLFPAAPPAPKEACRVSPDGKRLHLHFHFTDICIFFFLLLCVPIIQGETPGFAPLQPAVSTNCQTRILLYHPLVQQNSVAPIATITGYEGRGARKSSTFSPSQAVPAALSKPSAYHISAKQTPSLILAIFF